MLKKIKQTVLKGLKKTGAFHLVLNSPWRKKRLLILAYHGVSIEDEHMCDQDLFIPPEIFVSRLQTLRKWGCTILPLDEALRRLYLNDLPDNSVAMTFDEGFYNFHSQAHPVLKEFGIPATVYVTTFYVNYNRPIFDSVCFYLLWKGREQTLDLKPLTGQEDLKLELSRVDARRKMHDSLVTHARQHNFTSWEKDDLAARLASQLKVDYEEIAAKRLFNLMTGDEIRQLSNEGVDIQLHTHHHQSPLDRQLFRQEIEKNRDCLRALSNSSGSHFCYPSGIFDEAFFPWLKELGVVSATTCDPGLAAITSHPMMLPRLIDTCAKSPIEFEGWLTGIASALPKRQTTYNSGATPLEMRSTVSVHR